MSLLRKAVNSAVMDLMGFLAVVTMTFSQIVYTQDCPQDVVLIVDRAAYIGSSSPEFDLNQNWNFMKTFLVNLLNRMRYGVPNTQLATVTYGDTGTVVFNLNTYGRSSDASNALVKLDYMNGGRSNVSGAFYVTRTSALSSANGRRIGVPSICLFLVTYPPALGTDQTNTERDLLKQNCKLIVLAATLLDRLPSMASYYQNYPTQSSDYYATPFASLSRADIVEQIIGGITVACPTTSTPSTTQTTLSSPPETHKTTASTPDFGPTAASQSIETANTSFDNSVSSRAKGIIAGAVVGGTLAIVLAVIAAVLLIRKRASIRKGTEAQGETSENHTENSYEHLQFDGPATPTTTYDNLMVLSSA